jgi:hypothetical protein
MELLGIIGNSGKLVDSEGESGVRRALKLSQIFAI